MTSANSRTFETRDPAFAATRWTLVLRTRGHSPEAKVALGELCEAYWEPVFRFLSRDGRGGEAARELTQDFFARVLSGNGVAGASPELGRFRSFLLGALKHFLADLRDRERAAKRGGGRVPEPLLEPTETSAGLEIADSSSPVPGSEFDRQWAYALMDRGLSTLEGEFVAAGRECHFVVLKGWLVGDPPSLLQSDAARKIGLSEGAVKVAIHRMRKRFRELVRNEVSQTVPAAADVDEELRYLVEVLAGGGRGSQ